MAAAARLSPAASLLRHSRLFSLPPPLTRPAEHASSTPEGRSDTATLPYPIHAAIETPHAQRAIGEWGFKRQLPLKSTTRTGTPVIRIQGGIDTMEDITDFESAADHHLTLRKFQDIHMPMTRAVAGTDDRERRKNVFERDVDNMTETTHTDLRSAPSTGIWPYMLPELLPNTLPKTDEDPMPRKIPPVPAPKRWAYKGPWLAGMSGMEFDAYIKREVRSRRGEFRKKVKQQIIAERTAAQRREAQDQGNGAASVEESPHVTEAEFSDYMRSLRSRPDAFGTLIAEFLDLADGPAPTGSSGGLEWGNARNGGAAKVYRDVGPPQTHPSGGLSYLKVGPDTYARNDPVFGLQDRNTPVQARVLKTRPKRDTIKGSLGVAGIVADSDSVPAGVRGERFESFRPMPGGHKRLVRPVSASMTSVGTVDLNVQSQSSHQLMNDESVQRQEGAPALSPAAIAAKEDPSMPVLDEGYQTQKAAPKQSEEASSELREMFANANKGFDPFGIRGRRRGR